MKISYNWLKEYIKTNLSAEEISLILTNTGLEVENIEKINSTSGDLEGLVVGLVKICEKHPNADKLKITKIDVGSDRELNIVCGAPNVSKGQKVIVALNGSVIYSAEGGPIKIKKTKIRGEISEGMICSADEIGLKDKSEGIIVLPNDIPEGTKAADYFKPEKDWIFDIGLTPNRIDAASHIGVALDIAAVIKANVNIPEVPNLYHDKNMEISVEVNDTKICPRYSGVCISGVKLGPSPEWLQRKLKSVGIRTINNVVDITNYVLQETGQPLHAFDLENIKGRKIIVKLAEGKKSFVSLDGVEHKLSSEDLIIYNEDEPMCIAGIIGGLESGVKDGTKNIFLESAYFNPVYIRKTAKRLGIKTESSFRFERGIDPEGTIYALKRAASMISEIAGGIIASEIIDHYPVKIEKAKVYLPFKLINDVAGIEILRTELKSILEGLSIEISEEDNEGFHLKIPHAKVDVKRPEDVIEEILRIYGYDKIYAANKINFSLPAFCSLNPDKEKAETGIADMLCGTGFSETLSNPLTKSWYEELTSTIKKEEQIYILNPISKDLDSMRSTMLFSGLEIVAYNTMRRNPDLKLYEFGKIYKKLGSNYQENTRLVLFTTGLKQPKQWNTNNENNVDFYYLKGIVDLVLKKSGVKNTDNADLKTDYLDYGISYVFAGNEIALLGCVSNHIIKAMDISEKVFYADINWDYIMKIQPQYLYNSKFKSIPKYPFVKRDLSILTDTNVTFESLKKIAMSIKSEILRDVSIFDFYEGDKLPDNKKSYALNFILQDDNKTLKDSEIDLVMEILIKAYESYGAEIRK